MDHMMDHVGIYVNEKGNRYVYKRILTPDGFPNYYPPPDKNAFYKDMFIDEVLFLPIALDTFNTDRKNRFYGFRYLFNSSLHQTVTFGPDPLKLGWTSMQISSEIQRIRYYIVDKLDIVIDRVCDTLYPPTVYNIEDRSVNIGKTVELFTQKTIQMYDSFYADKQI